MDAHIDMNNMHDANQSVIVYENNSFAREIKISEIPNEQRVREITRTLADGTEIHESVPVHRIDIFFIGCDAALTTREKACEMTIFEYAKDGKSLYHAKFIKESN